MEHTTHSKKSYFRKAKVIMIIMFSVLFLFLFILVTILLIYSPGKTKSFLGGNGKILPGSISEKVFVDICSEKQGMFIVGKNLNNPVLLFLHGGPGMPTFFLTDEYPTGLEERFTVCYWEQRGGGLSFNPKTSPENLTSERIVIDAIEVTNYLRKRFGVEKIYLMGHSWGTFIGIQVAAKAPELYYAYIGISQISNQAESEKLAYNYMKERFWVAGNKESAAKFNNYSIIKSDTELIKYFKSPLRDEAMHELGIGTMRNMKSVITGIFLPIMLCKAYTIREKINIWRAKPILANKTSLIEQLLTTNLTAKVQKLNIPIYFFSGKYDYTVNYKLSEAYLENLDAPMKGFYTFEKSAHSPMHEEPGKFKKIIDHDVLRGSVSLADRD
jgi:pimeloyl-ACP methyl ester carboxylesterase